MEQKKRDTQILTRVIEAVGETPYSFAKKLNYKSVQSVYHVLDENTIYKLNEAMILKIVHAFPKVSYSFMKTGQGDVILEGPELTNQLNFFNLSLPEEDEKLFIVELRVLNEKIDRLTELVLELKKEKT